MAAFENLSPSQFNTDRSILQQGNRNEYIQQVRGTQTMYANIFRPSFSHDLKTVRGFRSPASAESIEEQENEE